MPPLKVGEIAAAANGVVVEGDPERLVDSFSIDSRALRPGGAFFALPGSRHDGHEYLPDAAKAQAALAVVARHLPPDWGRPPALVRVEDTAAALAACGALARKKIGVAPVYAVTGSAGKTTTKELLAAGLSARARVHRTHGNLNNHLGVPLTLLACPADAQAVVLELAMSGPGEIAFLAQMADPDVGLITNVRPVHMEYFRTLDDIAAAKGELFAVLRAEAAAVVNLDDEHVRLQAARHAGPRVTFGRHASADVYLESLEDRFLPGAGLTFRYQGRMRRLDLRLAGAHSAIDALAALAAVVAGGADLDAAVAAMAELSPPPGRGRVRSLPQGVTVVDDTYNSNPAALASVLRTMSATQVTGRKVLVMGDMLELGEEEAAYHKDAGRQAALAGVQVLMTVGALARLAGEAARKVGLPEVRHEPDAATAAREILPLVRPGDLIVVKGSRGVRLEVVVEALVGTSVEAH